MSKRRLNPLAFPAETNGRFTILIVAIIVLTWLVGFIFMTIIVTVWGSSLASIFQPITAATVEAARNDTYFQDLPPEELAAYYQSLRAPILQVWLIALPWLTAPLILVAMLLGIAWRIYRAHPNRIHRRHQHDLSPLDKPLAPSLIQTVNDLATKVNMKPLSNILIHKPIKSEESGGQAFGVRPSFQIRLKAQTLFMHRQPQFKALVLHELGHIINGDIWRTYFAQALWVTFSIFLLLIVGAITVIILFLLPAGVNDSRAMWNLLGQVIITLLIAAWIWRSLLQTRESYADWRAAAWGHETALHQWLATAAARDKSWWEKIVGYYKSWREKIVLFCKSGWQQINPLRKSWWQRINSLRKSWWQQINPLHNKPWWQRIISFHPSAKQRLAVLTEPLKLFQVTRQLPFFTGLLLSIIMIGFPIMAFGIFIPIIGLVEIGLTNWAASLFQSPDPNAMPIFILANFAFKILPMLLLIISVFVYIGYLLTTTLGVQIQRETIADMTNQVVQLRSYGRLAKSAFWVVVGVQIGLFLTPVGYILPTTRQSLFATAGWLVFFFIVIWLWLIYLRALTQIILGSHVGRTDPKRGKTLITRFSSISWAFLYPPAALLLLLAWIGDRSAVLPPLVAGSDLSSAQFTGVTVVVLIAVSALCFLGAAISLIVLYVALAFKPTATCPTCDEKTTYKIVLGKDCPYCNQPMALWIYLDETQYIAPQ